MRMHVVQAGNERSALPIHQHLVWWFGRGIGQAAVFRQCGRAPLPRLMVHSTGRSWDRRCGRSESAPARQIDAGVCAAPHGLSSKPRSWEILEIEIRIVFAALAQHVTAPSPNARKQALGTIQHYVIGLQFCAVDAIDGHRNRVLAPTVRSRTSLSLRVPLGSTSSVWLDVSRSARA